MAKYDPLKHFLAVQHGPTLMMDFDEVADLVNGLPSPAYQHPAWWANTDSHVQAHAWLNAGWVVDHVDAKAFRVSFVTDTGEPVGGRASGGAQREWNQESFFAELKRKAPDTLAIAEELYDWVVESERLEPSFGNGQYTGSMIAWAWLDDAESAWVPLFTLSTNGKLTGTWRNRPRFDGATWWGPYVQTVSRVSGVQQQVDSAVGFDMAVLAKDGVGEFKQAVDEVVEAARAAVHSEKPK